MSQMRKIASMNTPARKRLRSRFSDAAGSTNAEVVDASVSEPQPAASHSEKPAATRPRTRSTAKRTNSTRQTKRKDRVTSKPESVPLHKTTSATPPDHMGDDGSESDSGPAADPSTPVVKRKTPRLSRQGTRSSARLRGQDSPAIHGPTPIEPEIKQAKRKRESDDVDDPIELPEKRTKRADDQTDAPVQVCNTIANDGPPLDPVSNENVVGDHIEQPVNVVSEESAIASPSKDESSKPSGLSLQMENLRVVFGLGGSGS